MQYISAVVIVVGQYTVLVPTLVFVFYYCCWSLPTFLKTLLWLQVSALGVSLYAFYSLLWVLHLSIKPASSELPSSPPISCTIIWPETLEVFFSESLSLSSFTMDWIYYERTLGESCKTLSYLVRNLWAMPPSPTSGETEAREFMWCKLCVANILLQHTDGRTLKMYCKYSKVHNTFVMLAYLLWF